jgi:hypothetical protein
MARELLSFVVDVLSMARELPSFVVDVLSIARELPSFVVDVLNMAREEIHRYSTQMDKFFLCICLNKPEGIP